MQLECTLLSEQLYFMSIKTQNRCTNFCSGPTSKNDGTAPYHIEIKTYREGCINS